EVMSYAETFADSWRQWLHRSNILVIRSPGTQVELVTVSSTLADQGKRLESADLGTLDKAGVDGAVDIVRIPDGGVPLASEWVELLSQREMLPGGAEFANALAASEVAEVPEGGYETEEGVSLDVAWPTKTIAVQLEPEAEDAAELEDSGWTLVSATVDTVKSALGYSDVGSSTSASDEGHDDKDIDKDREGTD